MSEEYGKKRSQRIYSMFFRLLYFIFFLFFYCPHGKLSEVADSRNKFSYCHWKYFKNEKV